MSFYCGFKNLTNKKETKKMSGVDEWAINQVIRETDKVIYNNMQDEEFIIAYLDMTKSTNEVAQFLKTYAHKNIVIRYRMNQHCEKKEAIDMKNMMPVFTE
jgi:hypothetical protein